MLGQDRRPGPAPQLWFALSMALLVLALLGLIIRDDASTADEPAIGAFIQERLSVLVTSDSPATSAAAGERRTPTPAQGATRGAVVAAIEPPTPTLRPTSTRKPPDAMRRDHYWLERPIAPPGEDRVARFYPYASRMDGSYPVHHGVEFVNPAGTPVRAPAPGVVVVAGDDETQVYGARAGFYGQLVVIQLDQRYQGMSIYVLYAHLSEVQVGVGQHVTTGETVGLVGATGYAEAPHVHTEIRIGQNDYRSTVNPELWFRPREGFGTLAGVLLTADGKVVDTEAKLVLIRGGNAIYDVFTYPPRAVNSDPEWAENFAIGDLEAGEWSLQVFIGGKLHTETFYIQAGQTTWLPIVVD